VSICAYNCSRSSVHMRTIIGVISSREQRDDFYHEYIRNRIWIARDENTSEAENRIIASKKTMLTVLWNLHGFHVVTMLPSGELFNVLWFIDQDLVPLVQSFFASGWSPRQKMIVHIDNAPAHNSRMTRNFFEHNPLRRLLHPPYSPDISPSDFGLFWESRGTVNLTRDSG
jgi:hypothetical protein